MEHPEKFEPKAEILPEEAVGTNETLESNTNASLEDFDVDQVEGNESVEAKPKSLLEQEIGAIGEVLEGDITEIVEEQMESHAKDVPEEPGESPKAVEESKEGGISSLVEKLPGGLKKAINVVMLTSIFAGGMAPSYAEAGFKDNVENVFKNWKEGHPSYYKKKDRKAFEENRKRAKEYEERRIEREKIRGARHAGRRTGREQAQQEEAYKRQGQDILYGVISGVLGGR